MIELQPEVERLIPLAVTDRSTSPLTSFALPLNHLAVEQLLTTYERLRCQSREGKEHGGIKPQNHQDRSKRPVEGGAHDQSDPTGADLGYLEPVATAGGVSEPGAVVSATAAQPPPRTGGA